LSPAGVASLGRLLLPQAAPIVQKGAVPAAIVDSFQDGEVGHLPAHWQQLPTDTSTRELSELSARGSPLEPDDPPL